MNVSVGCSDGDGGAAAAAAVEVEDALCACLCSTAVLLVWRQVDNNSKRVRQIEMSTELREDSIL